MPSMLILVSPSSTLRWTTSPIAAAAAIVGSSPGAGSSTMPRTTLSFLCCADAWPGSARRGAPRSSERGRGTRGSSGARPWRGSGESERESRLYGIGRRALLRALALDVLGRGLAGRPGQRPRRSARTLPTTARAAASPAPTVAGARRRSPARGPRRCTGAAGRWRAPSRRTRRCAHRLSRSVSASAIASVVQSSMRPVGKRSSFSVSACRASWRAASACGRFLLQSQ